MNNTTLAVFGVVLALFAVCDGIKIYQLSARTGDKHYAGMDLSGFISISIFSEAGEHCHINSLDNDGNTFKRESKGVFLEGFLCIALSFAFFNVWIW